MTSELKGFIKQGWGWGGVAVVAAVSHRGGFTVVQLLQRHGHLSGEKEAMMIGRNGSGHFNKHLLTHPSRAAMSKARFAVCTPDALSASRRRQGQ